MSQIESWLFWKTPLLFSEQSIHQYSDKIPMNSLLANSGRAIPAPQPLRQTRLEVSRWSETLAFEEDG